jgi:hypothetical protein
LCGRLPARIIPINTITTITIASAIIPVVSAETNTGVGTGVGVSVVLLFKWPRAVAVGVGTGAAWTEAKVCMVPARNIAATKTRIKIMKEGGM